MRLWPFIIGGVALVVALFAGYYFLRPHPGGERSGVLSAAAWQRMASPGPLSQRHSFLEHNCAACHTPVRGVEAASCIACHASEQSLLQRQPTAFHADVGSCVECHVEHQGAQAQVSQMDHAAFARLSLRDSGRAADPATRPAAPADAGADRTAWQIAARIKEGHPGPSLPPGHPSVTAAEAALNCAACHANQDRHQGLFGNNCAQCHGTTAWTIPQFRHPPPSSTDCAQCHQAPPSHYMMHFRMVSMKVARQEHVQVSQCYSCHQTTAWNDIKGVGWYKHH